MFNKNLINPFFLCQINTIRATEVFTTDICKAFFVQWATPVLDAATAEAQLSSVQIQREAFLRYNTSYTEKIRSFSYRMFPCARSQNNVTG